MKKNKILIFGGNSLAAKYSANRKYIFKFYKRKNKFKNKKLTNKYTDIIIKKFKPTYIVNLIANTNVNECGLNYKKSYRDNFLVNKTIVDICKKYDLPLIFFSSDQLFDGKSSMYSEKSKTKPLNNYAIHKVMAENYIIKNLTRFLIIRTNFFADNKKSNLINYIKKNKIIKAYTDVIFNPLHIKNVWKIVYFLIELNYKGIFNLTSNKKISKYEFIKKVSKKMRLKNTIIKILLKKAPFQNKIERPLNMTLSNKKIKKIYKNKNIFVFENNLKIL